MDAVAGVHDINNFRAQTQIIQILDRIPHPRYDGEKRSIATEFPRAKLPIDITPAPLSYAAFTHGVGPHDIALYKTMRPFIFTRVVQPIRLSTDFDYKSDQADLRLLGWGALRTTIFIPDMPYGLQEAEVTYMTYKECHDAIENIKESNEFNPLDEDANLCTGPIVGGTAACVGDSGGPLIQLIDQIIPPKNDPVEQSTELYNASTYNCLKDTNCKYEGDSKQDKDGYNAEAVLLGIVSWGVSPCGEVGAPTVYTNVSAYKYFINYNMNN